MLLPALALALLQAASPASAADTAQVILDGRPITVEIAATAAERERGLMGRTQLARGHGMLFVFPSDAPRWFWMKNTLIPLDMLFFAGDGTLVSMQLNVPPCRHDPCPTYASNADARYVLELPGGAVDRLRIHQGDSMSLPSPPMVAQ